MNTLEIKDKLPDDASPAKVSAELNDGMLTAGLRKDESANAQEVELPVPQSPMQP